MKRACICPLCVNTGKSSRFQAMGYFRPEAASLVEFWSVATYRQEPTLLDIWEGGIEIYEH